MSIFDASTGYKPFRYPWAFQAYKTQRQMHWIPEEPVLDKDVRNWNEKLTESERNLITQIFRFFTQGDIDIAQAYLKKYIPLFKPVEVQMMLTQFAAMEALHVHAYSLLLDTLGMPETEYQAFFQYKEMKAKHDYFAKEVRGDLNPLEKTVAELAIFSAFGEGVQLFSSFAILLSFSREGFNLLEKMGRIITWSIRDENLHVESMIKIFHTVLNEFPAAWNENVKAYIYQACRDMVEMEDKFIDLAFEMGEVRTITKREVHQYIRFIADRRLLQLGLKPNYGVSDNPIPWIEEMINLEEFANFFETEVTEYSSGMMEGSWENAHTSSLYSEQHIMKYVKEHQDG